MNPMDLLQGDGIAWAPHIHIFIKRSVLEIVCASFIH